MEIPFSMDVSTLVEMLVQKSRISHQTISLSYVNPSTASSSQNVPQCPISQNQCYQLLNFISSLKEISSTSSSSGSGVSAPHQAASVMASSSIPHSASSIIPTSANFSNNPYWIPLNLSILFFLHM